MRGNQRGLYRTSVLVSRLHQQIARGLDLRGITDQADAVALLEHRHRFGVGDQLAAADQRHHRGARARADVRLPQALSEDVRGWRQLQPGDLQAGSRDHQIMQRLVLIGGIDLDIIAVAPDRFGVFMHLAQGVAQLQQGIVDDLQPPFEFRLDDVGRAQPP